MKKIYVEIANKIIKAYEQANFTELYKIFSDDIIWSSQWVISDIKGKEEVINYYDNKARLLKESNSKIKGVIVKTIEQDLFKNNSKQPQMTLLTPAEKTCVLIGQKYDDKENNMILIFELNDKLQITNISISDPSFYSFKIYE